jgi:hypothetical protein
VFVGQCPLGNFLVITPLKGNSWSGGSHGPQPTASDLIKKRGAQKRKMMLSDRL